MGLILRQSKYFFKGDLGSNHYLPIFGMNFIISELSDETEIYNGRLFRQWQVSQSLVRFFPSFFFIAGKGVPSMVSKTSIINLVQEVHSLCMCNKNDTCATPLQQCYHKLPFKVFQNESSKFYCIHSTVSKWNDGKYYG